MWTLLLAVASAAEPTCPSVAPSRAGIHVERTDEGDIVARGRLRRGVPDGTWCRWEPSGRLIEEATYVRGVREGPYFAWGAYAARTVGSYAGGERDGEWWEIDPVGALSEHGFYERGLKQGAWKEPGREATYADGVLDGTVRDWNPDGTLRREETWVDGRPEGPFHTIADGVDTRGEVHGGMKQGEWTVTDAQGLVERGTYVDDRRHGTWRIRGVGNFVDSTWDLGVQEGPFQVWSPSGQLQSDGTYKAGQPDGVWTTYVWGAPETRMTYEAGVLEGPYTRWSGARVVEEGSFHAGVRTGPWREETGEGMWTGEYDQGAKNGPWDLEGDHRHEIVWHHDRKHGVERVWSGTVLVSECGWNEGVAQGRCATWEPDGSPEFETTYVAGNQEGPYRAWHDDGTLAEEGTFVASLLDGPWKQWDEDGRPVAEGSYAAGTPVGAWVYWHSSGVAERRGTYDANGIETGEWTERYGDGTVRSRGTYADGVRRGAWSWWYPNGQREKRGDYDENGRTGEWVTWHPNGVEAKRGLYVDGWRNGRWTYRFPTGRVSAQVDFSMGEVVQIEPRVGLYGDFDPLPDEEDRQPPDPPLPPWLPPDRDYTPGLRADSGPP